MASCHRGAHHKEEIKRDLSVRLSRIEGQIRGITRMLEEDEYCDHILNQITAVRAALTSVQEKLLVAHFRDCVTEEIRQGNDEVVQELAKTIRRMAR